MYIDILYSNTKRRSLLLMAALLVGIECYAGTALVDRGAGRQLSEVLNTLKAAYHVDIAYSLKLVEGKFVDENIVISYQSNLEDNLKKILEPVGLMYKKRRNSYIIIRKDEARERDNTGSLPSSGNTRFPVPDEARHRELERLITGVVHDAATHEALPGVNVAVKGTTQGVVTDVEGKYSVTVEGDSSVLVFSSIGYVTREVKVGTQTTLDVELETDIKKLDEVVVTALGIKKEMKSLAYHVQQIKADELVMVRDANLVNALAGKVAGVTINTSSSGIGGAVRVVMRGTKSISGNNNTLYVIDGIPLPSLQGAQPGDYFSGQGQTGDGISTFNADDIESVSVLSGPAAAALYGSDAANGVVMITTKKGQKNKTSLDLSNSTTFYTPFVMPRFQNTYGSEPNSFSSWGKKLSRPTDYDPVRFFQTGLMSVNSLNFSTGTENSQTYFSAGTTKGKGIIPNNELNRYNFTIRNTSNFLNDKFSLDLGATYIRVNEKNMLAQGQYFNPLIPIYLFPRGDDIEKYKIYERYDVERNFKVQYWPHGDLGFQMQNPYWIINRDIFVNSKNRYLLHASLKYNINKWMNIVGRVRTDYTHTVAETKYYASTTGLFAGKQGGYYNREENTSQTYADLILNIDKTWKNFSVSSNIGGSFRDTQFTSSNIGGNLLSVPNLFTYANIDPNQIRQFTQNGGNRVQYQAVFATAQAGYQNKVFLDVTGRNDWPSQLAGTGTKSYFYPSIGLSGIVTDIFNMDSKVLSYLKLRASYSEVGNAPQPFYTIPTYSLSGGYPRTISFLSVDIKPERTVSYEAGLNAIFWDGKIKVDATVYQSSTYRQLFNPSADPSTGYSSYYLNAGQVDNKGIELSLGVNQKLGPIDWNSNYVFSLNRNRIVKLLPPTKLETGEEVSVKQLDMGGTDAAKTILKEGGSLNDLYVNTLKTDEHGYFVVGLTSGNVTPDATNFVLAGHAYPDYNMGWRNAFSCKSVTVSALINARFGGVGVSTTQAVMDNFGVSQQSAEARDAEGILINGNKLNVKDYYQAVGGGAAGVGALYTYSATNIRLAEMSISCDIPMKNYPRWIKGVSVSLIGRNLFMFYNKAPYDPELTASTGTYYQGIDYFMQPALRSMGVSLKLKF